MRLDINIDEVWTHKHKELNLSVLVIYKVENFIHYRKLDDKFNLGRLLGWADESFYENYIFNQKLTEEYLIKVIIE